MAQPRIESTPKIKLRVVDGVLRVNEYEILTTIGRGAFGEVNLARNIVTGDFVAMKGYSKKALSRMREYYRVDGESIVVDGVDKALAEVDCLCVLAGHPNITNLIEVMEDEAQDDMHLVFEYLDGGPLMSYDETRELFVSKATTGPLDESTCKHVFLDVVTGLMYAHAHKIVHRDLKPDNLLTTSTGITKIADFGVARRFKDGDASELSDNQGAPMFQSPEACVGEPYDGYKADVWALGVTLFVLVTGRLPFGDPKMAPLEVYEAIEKQETPRLPGGLSSELQDLVDRLLHKDPKKRISLADAKKHPWVASAPVLLPLERATPTDGGGLGVRPAVLTSARGHSWRESSVSFEVTPADRTRAVHEGARPLAVVESASSAWDQVDSLGTPRLPTSLNMYMGGTTPSKEAVFAFESDTEDSDDPDMLEGMGLPVTASLQLRASQREAKQRVKEWARARDSFAAVAGGGGSGADPGLRRRTSFPSMDIGSLPLYTSPVMLCLEPQESESSLTRAPSLLAAKPPAPPPKEAPPVPAAVEVEAPAAPASTAATRPSGRADGPALYRAPSINLPPGGLRGWLRKQGRLLKRYSKKYFVLRDHILAYYNSEPTPKMTPAGEYNLFTPGFETRVQSEPKPGFVFRFVIYLPHRQVTLLANTAEDYLQWLTALVEVVRYDWEARVRRLSVAIPQ